VFSCSKSEQKQLNTWVSFQSAEQPLLGQFSVSGNTHAPVRHQIRNLEDWFDFPLFRRDGRGICLIASGQALFDRVSPLFESMADFIQRRPINLTA